jgi:hypothetical protein
VPAKLTRDHLLPDHVSNVVQSAKPRRPPSAKVLSLAASRLAPPFTASSGG